MNKHQLRGSIYIGTGNSLKIIAGVLQEAGHDGSEQREWYDCKTLFSKLIYFTLEIALILFFTNFSFGL